MSYSTGVAERLPNRLASLTALYDNYMRLLGFGDDDELVAEGHRFMEFIGKDCHATAGERATGHEALAAMATSVFAATLARLGYELGDVRQHGGAFGVRARSLVHPELPASSSLTTH